MAPTELSRARKIVFTLVLILLCVLVIEAVSAIGLRLKEGRWVSKRGFVESLGAGASLRESLPNVAEAGDRVEQPRFLVHPFLGYVRNFEAPTHSLNGRLVGVPVNDHGFFGPSPMTQPDDEVLTVALTGGSVALELFLQARDTLRSELEKLPQTAGRRVEIVCLALGGMKQPQQLLALNYFLALGAHYDAVINLDGFNELVLTVRENLPQGVFPFFPRNWALYGALSIDLESSVTTGRIAELNSRIQGRARRLAGGFQRHSYLGLLVWSAQQGGLERRKHVLERGLRRLLKDKRLGPQQRGPAYAGYEDYLEESWGPITDDLLAVWVNSSLQMWRLSEASGVAYYHFLQPNQWTVDTKTLTDYELKYAMGSTSTYGKTALAGYPSLIAAGERLSEAGVPYADLTRIYRETRETVYIDNCCHVNQLGNRIMARAIAQRLGSG